MKLSILYRELLTELKLYAIRISHKAKKIRYHKLELYSDRYKKFIYDY